MKYLLGLLLVPFLAQAQVKQLSGMVFTQAGVPLADATIVLLDSAYQPVQESKASVTGRFDLSIKNNSRYYLTLSHLNYQSKEIYFRGDTVQAIWSIALVPNATTLEEAQVTGARPKVIRKVDRLEFNVQNSNLSSLNSWDILKRTPMVMVNGSTISVRGNQKIVVLINERKVMLTGDELKTLLENTTGSDVQSIEVITNPPAKYEAEGSTIINIKLLKSQLYGYRGVLLALAEQSNYGKQLFGLTQYYKNEKFNFRGTYNYGRGTYARYGTDFVYYPNEQASWESTMTRIDENKNQNSYVFSMEYTPDTTWSINMGLNGYYGPKSTGLYEVPTVIYDKAHVPESSYLTKNDHLESNKINNLYLQVNKKINPNWSVNWSSYFTTSRKGNNQDVLTDLKFKDQEPTSTRFISNNDNKNQLFSTQLDFTANIKDLAVEFGGKFSDVTTKSTLLFSDDVSGSVQERPDKSNVFDYDEQNFAVYTSMSYKWKKWSWKAGLRTENTVLNGVVTEPADQNHQNYWALFPTFYAQYNTEKEYQWGFSYGKRISRPAYSWLNPAKSYYNLFAYFQGDPRLRATIIHNLNLTLTKNAWNVDLFYRYEKWPSMEISIQDNSSHQLMYHYTNIKKGQGAGLDLSKSFQFTKTWSLNTQLEAMYNENYYQDQADQLHKNKVWIGNGNISSTYTLDKNSGWNLEIGNTFTSPTIQGPFKITGYSSTYLMTNRKFLHKRLEVNLSFMDIFKTEQIKVSSLYADQNNYYKDYRDTRKVNLTLRYHFGNQKIKSSNQPARTEEQGRL
ncbi:TonB-dependent receptor family protein [Sphingobacterium sp. SRCM116780]|uniref:outer membrane beta-barrel family protein n=1 Tax=Sphingobacterium sp. SRCM116780 TaxID=2907623 RepID=UPI001F298476|nr:outer membrane beta-barrel family protein [Sphingobacterium sp. SRCM116780]UIR56182.1 TonB-dependent receptor family protein [Sphingobacterium sp. SRCM116780]